MLFLSTTGQHDDHARVDTGLTVNVDLPHVRLHHSVCIGKPHSPIQATLFAGVVRRKNHGALLMRDATAIVGNTNNHPAKEIPGFYTNAAMTVSCGFNRFNGVHQHIDQHMLHVQVIRMWSNDQHDQSVIKEKIEAFNATIGKENGIAVEYTVYGSDYYSTLDVAVTSKEGPDIFKCNKIGKYAEAGYILPWEEIPALSALVERFSSYNAPGYGEFFGQTYSVPIRVTTYGIACNNQIFEENNLELPKTWAEMEEAARVITQNSRGRKYGYALAMGYGSYHYFYVTLANGASVGDEYFNHTTGRYDFASLSGFLKHVRTFIDDGSMFPGYESMNGDTARAQFSAGNIGMIGVMSSDVTTFKNQFPCDFEWTMIPYPVADAEHYYKEPVGVSIFWA